MIKVVIADDHVFMREGIKLMLENDEEIDVVGMANDGMKAFHMCESLKPDIVLMDLVMPVYDGIEGLKLIKSKLNEIKVIVLTTFGDEDNLRRALRYDADGYILKDIGADELGKTIKIIHRGLKVIHPEAYNIILKHYKYTEEDEKKDLQSHETVIGDKLELSDREKEIIKLVVYGKSNKEISDEINLSEGRVKNIITELHERFGLNGRTQLAVFAVKNKL